MGDYFKWDVSPDILNLFGPFSLRWYSLFFIAGILIGNSIFVSITKKEKKSVRLCESLLYYIVIGTVVGARLGHCLFYDPIGYLSNPLSILKVWEGGLASHGGYAGVLIAVYLFSRKNPEMSFFWIGDRIAICSILAGAFIRMGNFFNSEIVGRVTDVSWAIIFSRVDNYPRHPTQLYEALGYASISFVLYLFYRFTRISYVPGRLLGLGCILAFTFRALIEHFKENQVAFENGLPFNMGQLLSVPFILVGILLLLGIQGGGLARREHHSDKSFV